VLIPALMRLLRARGRAEPALEPAAPSLVPP
jgi:hypothetical protein